MNPSLFLVFIFAAATIFALVKIVAPFLEDREEQLRFEILDEELREIEELVARKSVLLQSLKDIEFDYETGKLSEEDYDRLRKKNERQAVRVMRQLDELRGDVEWDDEIDSALEQRLRDRASGTSATQRSERTEKTDKDEATVECPECGKTLEAEARFCSRCGHQLADASDASDTSDASSEKSGASDASGDVELETDLDRDPDGERNERSVSDLRSEATG